MQKWKTGRGLGPPVAASFPLLVCKDVDFSSSREVETASQQKRFLRLYKENPALVNYELLSRSADRSS